MTHAGGPQLALLVDAGLSPADALLATTALLPATSGSPTAAPYGPACAPTWF
ncbi:hypothetical protein ACWEGQ_29100 [Streptomyces seoulensis]